MGLQPRAFGFPSQACKDASYNYLHQPRHYLEEIWNVLKYITLKKYWRSQFYFIDVGKNLLLICKLYNNHMTQFMTSSFVIIS